MFKIQHILTMALSSKFAFNRFLNNNKKKTYNVSYLNDEPICINGCMSKFKSLQSNDTSLNFSFKLSVKEVSKYYQTPLVSSVICMVKLITLYKIEKLRIRLWEERYEIPTHNVKVIEHFEVVHITEGSK